MNRRTVSVALAWSVVLASLLAAAAGPVAAANELTDGIAPGIVDDGGDFGTGSVVVPRNSYITYMAGGAATLAGTVVEIWTNSTGEWTKATTRTFASDGSVRYFARVTGRTQFQARIPGTPGGSAHGRTATMWPVSSDHRTKITAGCDDFLAGDSNILVTRTAALKAGTVLVVTLCSDASTGFAWQRAAIDSAHIRVLGHSYTGPKPTNPRTAGAPGIETWTFLVTGHGEGHAVLAYSEPFSAGIEAAWIFVLETRS